MEHDNSAIDFTKKIALKQSRPARRGEPLISLMAGVLSSTPLLIEVMALVGSSPASLPGLVVRATIVLVVPDPLTGNGGKYAPGWWYVPEVGFWVLIFIGMLLPLLSIRLSRGRGRPLLSFVCLALHGVVLVVAYFLAMTNG